MTDRKDFTRIRGLSEIRRLPRLGKIRLGIKAVKIRPDGSRVEYPREVPYFVCPPEIQEKYGPQPTALDIMFPIEDETKTFPQAYKAYVANGLRCKGDGDRALRRAADLVWKDKEGKILDDATGRIVNGGGLPPSDPNALMEIGCPCALLKAGACSEKANLMVLLPKVSMGGVYQVDTGSYHNIVRINSAIEYVRLLTGRVALVPLVLHRQEEEIQYEGKKAKHYLLQITLNANLEEVAKLRENARLVLTQQTRLALPAPVEEGPEPTGEPPVEEEKDAAPPSGPPAQPAPTTQEPPRKETPVQYWKRNILTAKSPTDLKALWDNFAKKGGRYHDFTAQEQQDLKAAKEQRKAEVEARP